MITPWQRLKNLYYLSGGEVAQLEGPPDIVEKVSGAWEQIKKAKEVAEQVQEMNKSTQGAYFVARIKQKPIDKITNIGEETHI